MSNDEKTIRKVAVDSTRVVSNVSQFLQTKEEPKQVSRLKTGTDGVDNDLKEEFEHNHSTTGQETNYVSRLKTSVSEQEETAETSSLLKTNTKGKKGTATTTATAIATGGATETVEGSAVIKGGSNAILNKSKLKTADNGTSAQSGMESSKQNTAKKTSKFTKGRNRLLKTTDKVAKGIRSGARASQLMDKDNDGGIDYLKNQSKMMGKKVTRRVGNKVIAKPKQKFLVAVKNVMKALAKKVLSLLVSAGGYIIGIMMPISLILISVMLVSSIFGGGSSNKTIERYENVMLSTQVEYEKKVDDWLEANPDGVVYGGFRGGYGSIDWRASLSIIQSLDTKFKCGMEELEFLNFFYMNDLFEKHIEGTETITTDEPQLDENGKEVKDADGNVVYKTKEIKTLTIVNPSLDEYLSALKTDFSPVIWYLGRKEIDYKEGKTYFSKKELEYINTLYISENFFYQFSETVRNLDHKQTIGSNDTLANLQSSSYTLLNPYTRSGLMGQCTWYVWGRANEVLGVNLASNMGNANSWLNSATALGYKTGSKPSQNSIMVLGSANSQYGHVAYVEAWDGVNITYSEGNYNNPCALPQNNCDMVIYANQHYSELTHMDTVEYESLKSGNSYSLNGLVILGYIYLD